MLPVLYGSSWLGNLLLTVLACVLVFGQTDPLTPGVFVVAALCLLSGNLLPIAVYALQLKLAALHAEAEARETEQSVRHALERSEEVTHRLDEAEGALSKALLLARQLPQQVHRGMEDWEAMRGYLRELEVDSLNEALFRQSKQLRELRECFEQGLERWETFSEAANSKPAPEGGQLPEAGEQLDLLFGLLEGLQASVDDLSIRVAAWEKAGRGKLRKKAAGNHSGMEKGDKEGPLPAPSPQTELSLEPEESAMEGESFAEGEAVLRVQAMIGITNRLYVRGNGGGLDPERGTLLEATGIGQFERHFEGLEGPEEIMLYLNDEVPDPAGPRSLIPGEVLQVQVDFGAVGGNS